MIPLETNLNLSVMKINLKLAIVVLASLILLSFNCNNANAQLGLRVDGGVVDFKAVQLSRSQQRISIHMFHGLNGFMNIF